MDNKRTFKKVSNMGKMNGVSFWVSLIIIAIVVVGFIVLNGTGIFDDILSIYNGEDYDTQYEVSATEKGDSETEQPTDVPFQSPTKKPQTTKKPKATAKPSQNPQNKEKTYKFRNSNLLNQHYQKHGKDMGFSSAEEYEKAASKVVNNKNALHKTEKEDGDDVYYLKSTNEFVVVSKDGYIRTYFLPDAGIDYFNRQ